jgi:hypothetical protein
MTESQINRLLSLALPSQELGITLVQHSTVNCCASQTAY